MPTGVLVNWTGGVPRESGVLTEEDQTVTVYEWGALHDDTSVIGIAWDRVGITWDHVKFHSGSGDFGAYIHGPWDYWNGAQQTMVCTVWLDSEPDTI